MSKPLTPEAAARGQQFVEQLLKDGTPMETAKAALGQLMAVQALALNGGKKKDTSKKLGISREWLRELQSQAQHKRRRLIPAEQRSRN